MWPLVLKADDPEEINREVEHLLATNYSIHYHVWTQTELMELLLELRRRVAFEVELFLRRAYEVILVLRKGNVVATDLLDLDAPPSEFNAPLWGGDAKQRG